MFNNWFKKRKNKKENEFINNLPRYINIAKINNGKEIIVGYDTSKYFVDYNHKEKILYLTSKKIGKTIKINRKDLR